MLLPTDWNEKNSVSDETLEMNSNLFDVDIKSQNNKCIICQEDYKTNNSSRILKCMHYFHQECIDKWFENKDTCPICRTSILD